MDEALQLPLPLMNYKLKAPRRTTVLAQSPKSIPKRNGRHCSKPTAWVGLLGRLRFDADLEGNCPITKPNYGFGPGYE